MLPIHVPQDSMCDGESWKILDFWCELNKAYINRNRRY